jgi:YaiO family outer membrane protein
MNPSTFTRRVAALLTCTSLNALAQTEAPLDPVGPPVARMQIEGYVSRQSLTAGFEPWRETGVRGTYATGMHTLQGELATMKRFGESGVFAGFGDTVVLNDDWFATLSVGAGDGASYLPRYRVDSFINYKLLPARNLIGTLGLAYYSAPDGHADRSLALGATYYFAEPWVIQGEVRYNESNPGSVSTRQQFLAATWGRDKATQVTGRHAWGTEGYQALGAGASLVNFRSNGTSLAIRHWISPQWGLTAMVERYENPTYRRTGATLGAFWQLP